MSNKNSKNIPKIIFVIPIIIAIAVIVNIALEGLTSETVDFTPSMNSQHGGPSQNGFGNMDSTNNLYSGPFAILNEKYGIDDTVFFIGSEISLNSKGEILFIRPDGQIHHKIQYDGAKSAINHYFTPVSSSDLKECIDCGFFGIWEISFRPTEGISYSSIHFEVENNLKMIDSE